MRGVLHSQSFTGRRANHCGALCVGRSYPLGASFFYRLFPCSVDVLLTRCAAYGWGDRCRRCREGSVMVTESLFKSSEVRGARWVTLAPQFAMKGRSSATKRLLFVSGVADFL